MGVLSLGTILVVMGWLTHPGRTSSFFTPIGKGSVLYLSKAIPWGFLGTGCKWILGKEGNHSIGKGTWGSKDLHMQ